MNSAFIVRAFEALPLGRLSKQRMHALLDLVKGPLCATHGARSLLLPHLATTTKALLRDKAEVNITHFYLKYYTHTSTHVRIRVPKRTRTCIGTH